MCFYSNGCSIRSVSNYRRLCMFVCQVSGGYTFACRVTAVSGGSLLMCLQLVEALYVCVSRQKMLYVCVSSHWRLKTFVSSQWRLYTLVCTAMEALQVVYLVSGGSIRLCVYSHGGFVRLPVWSVEAPVGGYSIRLCVQSVEALYVSVSSHWRLITYVCLVKGSSIHLFVQPWRFYTFVYPVSGSSIRFCLQSILYV